MKRIGAGVAAFVVGTLALVTPRAVAQNGSAWLSPKVPEVSESGGEVVLTVEMWRAGRVEYRTFDGACAVGYSPGATDPEPACRDAAAANAPDDYASTSGELVFTEGGSKTITIPIVDDDVTDRDESFTVAAWEEVNADPWIDRGDSVIVLIVDDEGDEAGQEPHTSAAAGSIGDSTSAGGPPSASAVAPPAGEPASGAEVSIDPATPTSAMPSSRDLQVALPVGELRPGPGFELTSEGPPGPAPARAVGGDGSPPWLAIGSGAAAMGVGALAMVQRRRRWSPTKA